MVNQTLKLNVPDGWKVVFSVDEHPEQEDYSFENYDITPDENSGFKWVFISKIVEPYETLTPFENIESTAEDYLKELKVPDSIRPSTMDFIKRCEMGGLEAYYIVFREVGDAEAEILVVFDAPDERKVWVNAQIKDWDGGIGEASAIDFLSTFFIF